MAIGITSIPASGSATVADRLGLGTPGGRLRANQDEFLDAMTRARATPGETPEKAARGAAEALVSTALVQPILKRLRESNGAAAPFAPNQAERSFGPMRDAAFAQKLVSSQHWGLIDNLARRMLMRSGHASPAAAGGLKEGKADGGAQGR